MEFNNDQFTWPIFHPALDKWVGNIVFSIKETPDAYKQLGTISLKGAHQFTVTDLNQNIINPKFHGDHMPTSNFATQQGMDVFLN